MTLVYPQLITGADFLNGIIKLDRLAPLLNRRGAVSAAIVNSSLSGVRSFWKVMTKYGIHPVIGLSLSVELTEGGTALFYLYAKNEEGFKQLMKASSAAATRESGDLPEKWLHAYTANCAAVLPLTSPSWDPFRSEPVIGRIAREIDPDSLYIGVARPGGSVHEEEQTIVQLAETAGLPILACSEARFIDPEDAFSYETAQAIRDGYKLNDPARPVNLHKDAYIPEARELAEWFRGNEQWLQQAADLLLSCKVDLPEKQLLMPRFPVPVGDTAAELLGRLCREGLERKIRQIPEAYEERLRYELEVIVSMGYADYFLIVQDFIEYAKRNDIEVGPGRGSSAGSLVAFSLGITAVDPIRYGLIFERFLNKNRVTMPDIDVDFADTRRLEVVEYVAHKYGKAHVAQIVTSGTLSAKSVARNTARVFGFPNEDLAFISKSLAAVHGAALKERIGQSAPLKEWIAKEEVRQKWMDASLALEGLPRNASTHAAGVILSPKPLVETIPLQAGGDSIYLTQWAMNDAEEAGLLKMDFLGLRNLTLLDRIRKAVRQDTGRTVNLETMPLDDEATYELFRRGDMLGVFQFESPGMRKALRDIEPDSFEDIYAISALYRPGPMENIPLYSRRKKGMEPIRYLHPSLEPILAETYGIIVYQEQIMQIASRIAGFTFGEADLLRRAVSKKKREVLEQERNHFAAGAVRNGFPEEAAVEIYELIVKFADYGFPKSHAVAYSLISYQLAYFKANHPAQFYAACLTVLAGSPEKMTEYIGEMKTKGIRVLGPSITRSRWSAVSERDAVRLGIASVKGVPFQFYKAVQEARNQSAPLKTLFDLAVAAGAEQFNDKTVPPLIKSGALDEFGKPREVLLASIEAARKHALFVRPSDGEDLFAGMLNGLASPKYSPAGTMPDMQRLDYEKEVLGFYLSEHPAAAFKKTLEEGTIPISDVQEMKPGVRISIAGMLVECKRIRTKKGEAMAFLELQDETGSLSVTVFPKVYASTSRILTDQSMLVCRGKVEIRNGQPQLLADQIADPGKAEGERE
ncbi:DNA polymerase III subunit alpha [Sporosarcina trichiuri]|uniref:DNA polymerase III subunit alpha n=1 Tax=Sporosarcina trichiuri TaxID=3056445 RepID=UPI0025B407A6|nr:DNA polymerase III subunit alpha [Sporosarcina sp. 0.2-SM1T-5]WJY27972.1 DNA polymerase III subunit alpha [Sporosarcina sp. 0.2-SM1T-5]